MPFRAKIPSFLSNCDVFHDAVHSNTNLDPTILNLFHWDDDILNLQEKSQDCNLRNNNNDNVFPMTLNSFCFHLHRVDILNHKEGSSMARVLALLVSCQLTSPGKHFLAKVTSVGQHPCVQRAFVDLEV